jgi:uncharacterized metal-binding protein YceD (DUF177 family)
LKLVNQYIIPFKGLSEGEHNYSFEIEHEFFEAFSSLEINTGFVIASVSLLKKNNFLELHCSLEGSVEIQCDRCLEDFSFPILYNGELFVKFKEEVEEPDDKIIYLHPNDDILDLSQFFIDSIGLSIPIQRFHPEKEDGDSGCNAEMLDKLDELTFRKESDDVDPRWDKLKDLLNEGNKNE